MMVTSPKKFAPVFFGMSTLSNPFSPFAQKGRWLPRNIKKPVMASNTGAFGFKFEGLKLDPAPIGARFCAFSQPQKKFQRSACQGSHKSAKAPRRRDSKHRSLSLSPAPCHFVLLPKNEERQCTEITTVNFPSDILRDGLQIALDEVASLYQNWAVRMHIRMYHIFFYRISLYHIMTACDGYLMLTLLSVCGRKVGAPPTCLLTFDSNKPHPSRWHKQTAPEHAVQSAQQ